MSEVFHYYKPKTVLKLSVFGLFCVIFVRHEEQNEYRAFIEHSGSFITSDPDLEKLKIKVENHLLNLAESIIKSAKNKNCK